MKRLPRIFEGPWAWMAGGAFALLVVVGAANTPAARRLWSGPQQEQAAVIDWVVEPENYPPALLQLPGQYAPAQISLSEAARSEVNTRRAGFDERETPGNNHLDLEFERLSDSLESDEPDDSSSRSILKRLPLVEPPHAVESSLPLNELRDETLDVQRLPEFTAPESNDEINRESAEPVPTAPPAATEFDYAASTPESHAPGAGGEFQAAPESDRELSRQSPRVSSVGELELGPQSPAEPSWQVELPQPTVVGVPRSMDVRVERPAVDPQAMRAVSDRANELTRRGFTLANRGALYSARAEFVQALRLVSQALDAQRGEPVHSRALAAGIRALEEADDFVPKGSHLEADLNVASVAVSHQTPVLRKASHVTPLAAVQRYYTYAQEQLSLAGGGQPAASSALFGLGKIHLALSKESIDSRRLSGPKALTMHQAALSVDPRNHWAANELGVLLARYGQLNEAKRVLLVGLATSRRRETWHNLAVVHEKLGETDLAGRARHEERLLTDGPNSAPATDSLVRWVPVKEFSASGQGADAAAPAIAATAPAARTAAATNHAAKKSGPYAGPWK